MINIAIINRSTLVQDADVATAVKALQIQVSQHWAPIWGTDVKLSFVPSNQPLPKGDQWWLALLDDSDQAGALGYHDLTAHGKPLGKAFAKTCMQFGMSWTVTLSHELLEMIGDPMIDQTIFYQQTATTGLLYACEVCDPCEDDSFGYKIPVDGTEVLVSDFTTPFYRIPESPAGVKFDFCGHIKSPLSLLTGGFLSEFPVTPQTKGWTQINAEKVHPSKQTPAPGTRRERRVRGRNNWLRSTAQ